MLEVIIDIQRHGGAQAISFGMSEDDVREVMRQEFVATASDGATHLPGKHDQPHPRSYGTFPRKVPTPSTTRCCRLSRRFARVPAGRPRFSGFPIGALSGRVRLR